MLRLSLLGGFQARLPTGSVVRLPAGKVHALLAYLALRPGQAHPRDKLASLLWGEGSDEQARHSLRQALVTIRRTLPPTGPSCLLEDADGIALNPAAVEVDVGAFERLAADGSPESLDAAAALYRGDLLEGLPPQGEPLEEWLLTERERLRELAFDTLARILAQQTRAGSVEVAIGTAVRLLGLDRTQEAVHRTLMHLYAQQGRRGAALRQYQSCVATLRRDLGVGPEPETRKLYQMLLRERAKRTGLAAAAEVAPSGALAADALLGAPEAPFVGREAELARIGRDIEAAWSGEGRIALIRGEAGIGKSRLVAEAARIALDRGAHLVVGRAHESQRILPFAVWVEALRGAGLPGEAGRAPALGVSVRRELARLFPELGSAPVPMSQDYGRLFEALAFVLLALGSEHPRLLVLEDLQWADDMSLRFLAFMSRRIDKHRLLILATAREEEIATAPMLGQLLEELQGTPSATIVHLGALSREQAETLIGGLTAAATPDRARLVERLWTTSEGNPFVLVELARAIREGSDLGDAPTLPLPDRVRGAIAHRLAQLGERERHVLSAAAVIGREFPFRLLQRVAGLAEPDVAEAAEQLVAWGVLHAVGDQLDFVQDRIREVAYGRLLPPRRVALHEATGRALEELYPDRLDQVADRLAFHFARTEHPDKAVAYLARFAERAVLSHAHAEAIAALAEARALVDRLPVRERDRWLVTLALREAFSLAFLGRFRDTLERLLPLGPRVEALADPALAGPYFFRLGITHSYLGDQAAAAANARRALAEAAGAGDVVTEGQAHYVLALSSHYLGALDEGVEHAGRAIVLLEGRAPHWRGLAQWLLAFQLGILGEFDRALEATRALDVTAEALGEPRLQSFAAWTTGTIHLGRDEADAAVAACRRAVALVSAQDAVAAALAKSRLGYALVEAGDAESAIPLLEEVTQAVARFGFRQVVGGYTVFLAEAYLVRGDLARARALATEALEVASILQSPLAEASAERALGRVALAARDFQEAERWLAAAVERYECSHARAEVARTRLLRAEVAAALGHRDAASSELRSAHGLFTLLRAPRAVERAEMLAGELGIELGDTGAAGSG